MFRRRRHPSFPARVRELLWPRSGWRRWASYLAHRVKRLPGTPHRIAAGLAAGAAVSCAPLPGLHFLLAVLLALATRGSPLASAIGTAFGNPWTFPLLWSAAHSIGTALVPGSGADDAPEFAEILAALPGAVVGLDFAVLTERILPALTPMLVGSVPLGLAVWLGVYLTAVRAVAGYQRQRSARLGRPAVAIGAPRLQSGD